MDALAYASIRRLAQVDLRIEPCVVPPRHRYGMPSAPIERFVYITEGRVRFSFGDKTLQAGPRDMVYLPCEIAYRSEWPEKSAFMVVDLMLHDTEEGLIRFGDSPCVLFCDKHGAYRGLLEELAAKAESCAPFDWLERLSLSFKFLCEVARDTNRTVLDEHRRKVKEGLTYLEHNFTEDFTVEELARMCCLSVGSFRKSFAECMGMSPVEYRNRLRIRKAVDLLRGGDCTVSETAEAVGIGDVKYFSKLFKRYAGVSPRTLRKE